MNSRYLLLFFLSGVLLACSPSRYIARSANKNLIRSTALRTAHTGISIYEPATGKTWYDYQGDHYFVPASNTKIITCYTAMKYLGDSLEAARMATNGDSLFLQATGDPSFLQAEFTRQPLLSYLKENGRIVLLDLSHWKEEGWGSGWSWDDYMENYMAERSALPLYGNVLRVSNQLYHVHIEPRIFNTVVGIDSNVNRSLYPAAIKRSIGTNQFTIVQGTEKENTVEVPYLTKYDAFTAMMLADTLRKEVILNDEPQSRHYTSVIHSQPTDSILKILMYRSDNFYAEQSLLMVSDRLLGEMNDSRIIDTLLKTEFSDLPQKPRWVDGSGLSRYNLFTPQDFVKTLDKMRTGFGMERIKRIFPSGKEGTLRHYFKSSGERLYAKTGSMSGVLCLSGYLYTEKNRLLLFSILINNHQASVSEIRKAISGFLEEVGERM